MVHFSTLAVVFSAAIAATARPAIPTTLRRQDGSGSGGNCPANLVSCSQQANGADSCCVETPGGQIVQTQFWDTKPATGPTDSWTIHGLWPDNCSSGYQENCDPSRDYSSIQDVLEQNGKSDLVDFMNQYWVDIDGNNAKFWAHEWSTHGTCMSTIAPACLGSGAPQGLDAAYYFQKAVDTFKSLPTYQYLQQAGITPDSDKTYTYEELTDAIQQQYGYVPELDCSGGKYLNTIYYYFNLQGTIIDGTFIPFDAPTKGNCPSSGIKYVPKNESN